MHLPQKMAVKMRYLGQTANPIKLQLLDLQRRMKGWIQSRAQVQERT